MTGHDMRQGFLQFFADRGPTIIPSSSLLPGDDPTLLFTNAGMVQFKDVFLGKEGQPYSRATTAQKCLRASRGCASGDDDADGLFRLLLRY
jgi:alanyl-tRNA synthetase